MNSTNLKIKLIALVILALVISRCSNDGDRGRNTSLVKAENDFTCCTPQPVTYDHAIGGPIGSTLNGYKDVIEAISAGSTIQENKEEIQAQIDDYNQVNQEAYKKLKDSKNITFEDDVKPAMDNYALAVQYQFNKSWNKNLTSRFYQTKKDIIDFARTFKAHCEEKDQSIQSKHHKKKAICEEIIPEFILLAKNLEKNDLSQIQFQDSLVIFLLMETEAVNLLKNRSQEYQKKEELSSEHTDAQLVATVLNYTLKKASKADSYFKSETYKSLIISLEKSKSRAKKENLALTQYLQMVEDFNTLKNIEVTSSNQVIEPSDLLDLTNKRQNIINLFNHALENARNSSELSKVITEYKETYPNGFGTHLGPLMTPARELDFAMRDAYTHLVQAYNFLVK